MPVQAGEAEDDGGEGQNAQKDHRIGGEALLPGKADDQVEDQPDQDAGGVDQDAEAAQAFEIMLREFKLQGRRSGLFEHLFFKGSEHLGPWM